MNKNQFIAKQRIKYLWKTIRRSDYDTGSAYRDVDSKPKSSFWDYEPLALER